MNDVQLTGWFYLSFADDDAFYGGVIVNAPEFMLAHLAAGMMGLNPGKGSCLGYPIPEGFLPEDKYRNKLLTKAEISSFWPDAARLGDLEDEAAAADSGGNGT